MPWAVAAAAVGAAGAIGSSMIASDAQEESAERAQRLEQQRYEQNRTDLRPYREAGEKGLGGYADAIGLNGPEAQARAMANFRVDPSYQFDFDEGMRAVEGSAAARGGLLSGGTLKDLTRFGQGQADRQYGSYLDRFLNAANIGQAAAGQTTNLGAASGAREGGYIQDAGAARAGGYLSAAQGVNGAIGNSLAIYGYGKGQGWFDGNSGGYTTPDGMPRGYYVNK